MIALMIAFTAPASNAIAHSSGNLAVKNAWINEAPPNAKVLAAYMVIHNHTEKKDSLVSISSKAFAKVETHQSKVEDGMARMIKLPKIELPAQGKAVLEQGGMHLMLTNPKKLLKQGDQVEFILQFESGKKIIINAMVKRSTGHSAHDPDHGQNHPGDKHPDNGTKTHHKMSHNGGHDH